MGTWVDVGPGGAAGILWKVEGRVAATLAHGFVEFHFSDSDTLFQILSYSHVSP